MARIIKKQETSNFSNAIETLSAIAELDPVDLRPEEPLDYVTQESDSVVSWLKSPNKEATIEKVRDLFKAVLNYFHKKYPLKSRYIRKDVADSGIKSLMLIVGEAAKKIDKCLGEKKEVMELLEYKHLQDFYRKKVDRKIDQQVLSKWIMGLTKGSLFPQIQDKFEKDDKHIFVDLDAVRSDSEYELMLIRKEDGSRFFNPRLIRNIKLVCDFGGYLEGTKVNLEWETEAWLSQLSFRVATQLLKACRGVISDFFHEGWIHQENELVQELGKSIIALMLAANPLNVEPFDHAKSSKDYFMDFQDFFREALNTRPYQKMIIFPPKQDNIVAHCLLDLISEISQNIFLKLRGIEAMFPVVEHLIHEARKIQRPSQNKEKERGLYLWTHLAFDFGQMLKLLRAHSNSPLIRILETIEGPRHLAFDSLLQNNIPNSWFDLIVKKKHYSLLRIPSPTRQVVINKADVTEEFKNFLFALSKKEEGQKHLLINLQDRTSWQESARAHALENLLKAAEFKERLSVATLATGSEFFYQISPYEDLNESESFKKQFEEHLLSDAAGFFFPSSIKKELSEFILPAIEAVHTLYFQSSPKLSRQERLDFIMIFYCLLELKLIELISPSSFSLTCKDGLDTSGSFSSFLFAFLKLHNQAQMTEAEREYLNLMLYGPPLLVREREMLPEEFNRFINALKVVESSREKLGQELFFEKRNELLGPLFKSPIMQAEILLPRREA